MGTLCRIWWSVVAIDLFLAAAPAMAQDEPAPRMAIEQAMREAAIRLQYLNLTPSWPACGEESEPMYPPDGYYGTVIEKNDAASLVGSLASAILTLVQEGNFLREEYVQAIDSDGYWTEATVYDLDRDFPALASALADGIDETNCDEVFALIQQILEKLKYQGGIGVDIESVARGGTVSSDGLSKDTCEEGYDPLHDDLLDRWGITTPSNELFAHDGAEFCELTGGSPPVTTWDFVGVQAAGARGTLNFSFPAAPEVCGEGSVRGTAKVYLSASLYGDSPRHDPPVPPDDRYHEFDGVPIAWGDPYESEEIGPAEMPEFFNCGVLPECCEGDWTEPSDPVFCSQNAGGWDVTGQLCILTLEFSPDSGQGECGGEPCPETDPVLGEEGRANPDQNNEGNLRGCPTPVPAAGNGGSGAPAEHHPVSLASGHKLEREVDIDIPLVGRRFQITREYSSQTDLYGEDDETFGAYGLVGANWGMNVFQRLIVDEDTLTLTGPPMDAAFTFTDPEVDGTWTAGGPATQVMTQAQISIDGGDDQNVWRLTEPGQWERDYYRAQQDLSPALEGHILQERDMYGNTFTYQWKVFPTPDEGETARLLAIFLNGSPEDSNTAAVVTFTWNTDSDEGLNPVRGRLDSVAVRAANKHHTLLARVHYLYMIEGGSPPGDGIDSANPTTADPYSGDLGTNGDLIQVTRSDMVDRGADAPPFWTRVTQYRYHDGEGETPLGQPHQLKAVILPEQVEFLAQAVQNTLVDNSEDPLPSAKALVRCATQLLATDDLSDPLLETGYAPLSVGFTPNELASKRVEYIDGAGHRVAQQALQTACGCGGSSQGLLELYTYIDGPGGAWHTTRITERRLEGESYVDHRIISYDLKPLGANDVRYLINKAIEEPGQAGLKWVWHYTYDTSRNLERVAMPSALSSYTAAVGGGSPTEASYTASTNSGLVYAYGYTADHRLSEERLGNGNLASYSSFTLVTRTNFPDPNSLGTDQRLWLPVSVERFRVESPANAGDVETTTFAYGFHDNPNGDDNAIAWIKTAVETEPESENGPSSGTTYDSYDLFDGRGLNRWSRAADLALTFRRFDLGTGSVIQVTRNADPTQPDGDANEALDGADYDGVSISGWGTVASGGELTTTYAVDRLGRLTVQTLPGGVQTYTIRELAEEDVNPERGNLLYYRELSLPFRLPSKSEFDGAASSVWLQASGKSIRASDFAPDANSPYVPSAGVFTLSDELSRSVNSFHMSGLMQNRKAWHDISGDRFYATNYEYDGLGRATRTTSPTGSITEREFDLLDRMTSTSIGATGEDITLVAEYFYDHTISSGDPVQGQGDGNLTFVRAHTGENNGLAADERDTIRTFDFRDRLITVQNPQAPHEFIVYDNLDRIAKRAMFDGTNGVPTGIGTPLTDRGLYTESLYNQRGLHYRQKVAIVPNVVIPAFLETNSWFDAAGAAIAVWAPNAPTTKRTHDGLGRVVTSYTTDRAGDPAPGGTGNYSAAASISDDHVIEQVENSYLAFTGRLSVVSTLKRFHDATATGALTSSSGVATYVAYYYDPAQRLVRTVDFGTNTSNDRFEAGGSAPSPMPGDIPDPTDLANAVVSGIRSFNARGLIETTIDPRRGVDKYFYDDLSRRIGVAEEWEYDAEDPEDAAALTWDDNEDRWVATGLDAGAPSVDRVTSFVYDGDNNIVKQVAHEPGSPDAQVTEYVYGTTVGSVNNPDESLVASNDLLREVRYPDETTGDPGSSDAYKVKYAYNAQGELRSILDQNGTRHDYSRDLLGRVLADTGTVIASGIDNRIKRIGLSFDGLGRISSVNSYTDTSGTTAANGVKFTYTSLWQTARVYQDYDGVVTTDGTGNPTGNTKVLTYSYSGSIPSGGTAGSDYSRVTNMQLPYGTNHQFNYGSSGSVDDRISRVAAMKFQRGAGSANTFVNYGYVGLDMAAVVEYPLVDLELDRTLSTDGKRRMLAYTTQAAGVYPGWDRWGRVVLHTWADDSLTTNGSNSYPNKPPLFQEAYTYDKAGNKLTRADARPGATWANRDWQFTYDGLDRLLEAKRGVLSGQTMTAGIGSQDWALDALGNWVTTRFDLNGDNDYGDPNETDNRVHNQANELSTRDPDGAGGANPIPLSYDASGNMTVNGSRDLTHDAWNRLVKVRQTVGANTYTIGEYEYNGLHWRTLKRADSSTTYNGLDELRVYYYTASWQLAEEWIDVNYISQAGFNDIAEQYWGARYIDDAVMRRLDIDSDGTFRQYMLFTDAQFSVIANVSTNGSLNDRVVYDSYGKARHHRQYDVDGDGDQDATDKAIVQSLNGVAIGNGSYKVEADLDRSGTINGTDAALFPVNPLAALPSGWICAPAGADCPVGYDGYMFNPETNQYTVRFRSYDSTLGRWMERDPAGFVGGMNLYQYVDSGPTMYVDPWGLDKLVFDGKKLCRVSDDLKKCIKCWKGRSGKPIKDKDGNIERDETGMPKFPEPTVEEQKKEDVGPIPEGNWKVPCKQESKDPGNKGFWKRTDWNDYDKKRGLFDTNVDPRSPGPWGEWFVRCEPGKDCEVYGRRNFNIHGGRSESGGEWGSAGCVDLMCQDDDFFKDLTGMCGTGTHIDLIVDYSGKSMPAGCNEPDDPCKKKDDPKKEAQPDPPVAPGGGANR